MMSKRLGCRSYNGDVDGMFKQGLSTGLFFLNLIECQLPAFRQSVHHGEQVRMCLEGGGGGGGEVGGGAVQ